LNPEPQTEQLPANTAPISPRSFRGLKILGAILTLAGVTLFGYFIYIEGINDIATDIARFGWIGFIVILGFYFLRITSRAWAWKLSIY